MNKVKNNDKLFKSIIIPTHAQTKIPIKKLIVKQSKKHRMPSDAISIHENYNLQPETNVSTQSSAVN